MERWEDLYCTGENRDTEGRSSRRTDKNAWQYIRSWAEDMLMGPVLLRAHECRVLCARDKQRAQSGARGIQTPGGYRPIDRRKSLSRRQVAGRGKPRLMPQAINNRPKRCATRRRGHAEPPRETYQPRWLTATGLAALAALAQSGPPGGPSGGTNHGISHPTSTLPHASAFCL